jgi:flagellar assembly protein FliH
MNSSSPEGALAAAVQGAAVLRGQRAGVATAARFDVDLRGRRALPAELRAEAHAAGYAAGWSQGRQEAEAAARAQQERERASAGAVTAELTARAESAIAALGAAAAALEQRSAQSANDIETAIATAALALAEAIVGRELAAAEEPGADALARALRLAPAGRPVTVRLNPADHELLAAGCVAGAGSSAGNRLDIDGRTVTLVADASLRPGDALAECDASRIDARIGTAIERVREVLQA